MASKLKQVLTYFEVHTGAISVQEMARELDVETGTLTEMIDYWVRRGKLRALQGSESCTSCGDKGECPHIMALPRHYELQDESTADIIPINSIPCQWKD